MVDQELRHQVLSRIGIDPDPFQVQAFDALDEGQSVLVCAPTGSGKTLVADYAIARCLQRRERAFYTTPLKALSNQKFLELSQAFGEENVGLLTGDVSVRPHSPVVVMTTEVLRNMLFAESAAVKDMGLVILDEVHYLQDATRGSVWEEILMTAGSEAVFVSLSATLSNAEQFGAWLRRVRGPTRVIVETRRPVQLQQHVALAEKGTRDVTLMPVMTDGRMDRRAKQFDSQMARLARRPGGLRHSRLSTPRRSEMVEALRQKQMLPAIFFIFSRNACEAAVEHCLVDGLRITTSEDRREIRRRCEMHTEAIADDELRVLGYGKWLAGLEAGFAPHHAGMIPAFREAVEDLFFAGLIKVVFATETLSLGINMPARTVVIERLTKVRDAGRSMLTSGEFAQLTGRAGRRGLDSVGHAVVLWSPNVVMAEVADLVMSDPPALRSSFRPSYNLAVNLVSRYPSDKARWLLDRSFAQFMNQRHGEALSRRFDRALWLLERWGCVDSEQWQVTDKGRLLARVSHESDLLISEALSEGLFDGLTPPHLAAVASAFTYESRRGDFGDGPSVPKAVAERVDAVIGLAIRLRSDEDDSNLPRTRIPEDGFTETAWRWVKGDPLERVLAQVTFSPGDFVRNAKQLIDLLSQLELVAPDPTTRSSAAEAITCFRRGVVAASTAPPRVYDTTPDSRSLPDMDTRLSG